mmetsp:Transcript_13136/g.14912  ORF Transcript_13136/g.14912 Transcript_13136/m.14912 type:complete len:88 (+) Transcript_13136:101-364(+)
MITLGLKKNASGRVSLNLLGVFGLTLVSVGFLLIYQKNIEEIAERGYSDRINPKMSATVFGKRKTARNLQACFIQAFSRMLDYYNYP